jgi:hypothetical protein
VASDRNPQAVQFIEPNVVDGTGLAVGQNDGSADKLGLRLTEFGKDGGCSGLGGR